MDKKTSRLRRAKRARAKISELGANRFSLTVLLATFTHN